MKIILTLLVLMSVVSCASGPLTSMDRERSDGGRISKLNYTTHEKAAEEELSRRMKEKCPNGYEITEKGKRPYHLGRWASDVDYFDFKCKS